MPFPAHIYMCTHTHPSWGVGVLSPTDSPSITSPVSCHATPDFIIMPPSQLFFSFWNVTQHPNTHHLLTSSLSFPPLPKTKEEALLCFIMAFRLYLLLTPVIFLLPLGLFPLWIVRVCREGPFVLHYIEPPHSQWNADRNCSKVACAKEKYSWGQLSFKCGYAFRLDIDNSSCIDPDNRFLISSLVSWPAK